MSFVGITLSVEGTSEVCASHYIGYVFLQILISFEGFGLVESKT